MQSRWIRTTAFSISLCSNRTNHDSCIYPNTKRTLKTKNTIASILVTPFVYMADFPYMSIVNKRLSQKKDNKSVGATP